MKIVSSILLSSFLATSAHAVLTFTFQEEDGNLTVIAGGTFDTDSANSGSASDSGLAGINPSTTRNDIYVIDGTVGYVVILAYPTGGMPITLNTAFGSADTTSGDPFGIQTFDLGINVTYLYGPNGYVTGDSLSGSATWNDVTLADIGRVSGESGSFTLAGGGPSQSFTWSTVAVPEPANYAAVIGALMLAICGCRRRRT